MDTVKSLIEKGADVNCKDNEGVSECNCATDCGSVQVNLVPKYLHWYPVLILCNWFPKLECLVAITN